MIKRCSNGTIGLVAVFVKVFFFLKFIYSEKATKICEITIVDLTGTKQDKSMVEIFQNFVAFSEYLKFNVQPFSKVQTFLIFFPFSCFFQNVKVKKYLSLGY